MSVNCINKTQISSENYVEIIPSRKLNPEDILKRSNEKIDGVEWYIRYRGKVCPQVGETREQAIMMAAGLQWGQTIKD